MPVVADEIAMSFDIGSDLDVIPTGSPFDRDRELLKSIEKAGELSDLRLDVVRQCFGQFHMFCADCDEHGSILQ